MFFWVQRRSLQIALLAIAVSAQVRAQTDVPSSPSAPNTTQKASAAGFERVVLIFRRERILRIV